MNLYIFAHDYSNARDSLFNDIHRTKSVAPVLRRLQIHDCREDLVGNHPDKDIHLFRGDKTLVFPKSATTRFRQ